VKHDYHIVGVRREKRDNSDNNNTTRDLPLKNRERERDGKQKERPS
jgi:hypothetical protein